MKWTGRHLSYANVVATLALVLALSGGAIAATGGFTSGGKLHACVNEEGRLKLLKSGGHCKRGQKSVSWAQIGPAGPVGIPGATGPKGIEGQKGAPGEAADVKWAAINKDGGILGGRGVVAARKTSGHYVVAFDSDITNCAVVASQNSSFIEFFAVPVKAGTEVTVFLAGGNGTLEADFSVVAVC
jgi:hypothetical protein